MCILGQVVKKLTGDDDCVLGVDTMQYRFVLMFQRNILPPSSGWLNLVEVDADVTASQPVCQLHGKVQGLLNNQSNGRGDRVYAEPVRGEISKNGHLV
jgi:hypothetical protein